MTVTARDSAPESTSCIQEVTVIDVPSVGTMQTLKMCMGMGFPIGTGIPWEFHGNGNKTQNWEWVWQGMGNHLSGNGNYLHSHGNLSPKVLCCDEMRTFLVK